MPTLIHIRVGKELKGRMQALIDAGLFSNQAEIAREAIRDLLVKYKDTINLIEKKNEKDTK